ncbi:hypothetical protein FALBO_2087 [Fusarium albosuccineum]|uniref:Apple domain-containing protein n=1 Tax=Fusarium albosuccineum TaxID=1237068 RepID=A0A8H4PI25_9HYPO|nr:hypothetical protein FALBO_2087 [Fusarium albosuccineum]
MRSVVAFAALALSGSFDLAVASRCKPSTTADITTTDTATSSSSTETGSPPVTKKVRNLVANGGLSVTDPSDPSYVPNFLVGGKVQTVTGQGYTGDKSKDKNCASMSASNQPQRKRALGPTAKLSQDISDLDQTTPYTVRFYYQVTNPPSLDTACEIKGYLGENQFYQAFVSGNDIEWVEVLQSVDALSGTAAISVELSCSSDDTTVFVDSIFLSNLVTKENIDEYDLDFGDETTQSTASVTAASTADETSASTEMSSTSDAQSTEASTEISSASSETESSDSNTSTASSDIESRSESNTAIETQQSATDVSASETSTTETSTGATSATETETAAGETSTTETSATDSAAETSSAETSATETVASEETTTESSTTEVSSTETSASESSVQETSAIETSAPETVSRGATTAESAATEASSTEASLTETSASTSASETSVEETSATETVSGGATTTESSSMAASVTETSASGASSSETSAEEASATETISTTTDDAGKLDVSTSTESSTADDVSSTTTGFITTSTALTTSAPATTAATTTTSEEIEDFSTETSTSAFPSSSCEVSTWADGPVFCAAKPDSEIEEPLLCAIYGIAESNTYELTPLSKYPWQGYEERCATICKETEGCTVFGWTDDRCAISNQALAQDIQWSSVGNNYMNWSDMGCYTCDENCVVLDN